MKQTKILDNKSNGKVCDELKANLNKGSKLSVISAYFTIYAFEELKKELLQVNKMRLLYTEPSFLKKDEDLIRQYYISRIATEQGLSGNEFEIKLRNELNQAHIAKECAAWLKEKVEVRSYKTPNPAQTRLMYIENHEENLAISGSADFTTDGLGITPSKRFDTNICMFGTEETKSLLKMFDDIWNDETLVEDVKQKVLDQMQVLYRENTPEFIYFVTLYNVFNEYLEELTEENIVKSRTGFKETSIWNKLYKFQRDGVIGAIDKIEKYNGCIIADSVGLGKTFTALAVIKYYELRNDRVLVLAPKKLRENWAVYTQNDKRNLLASDRFNFDVLNHTDLSRYSGYSGEINLKTINWANYDLVVIDESHNFRNNQARKDKVTRYSRLMDEIIRAGVKTKILMLSATPVNNKMNDIKNQIAFITEGKDKAFSNIGIESIEVVLRKAQTVFNKWSKQPEDERTTESFLEMMNLDYFKLLDTVTIARSRKHIEKYYDLKEIGKFPERQKPQNIKSDIDLQNEFPSIELVNKTIKKLNLGIYAPLAYVLPEKREAYDKKYDMQVGENKSLFRQVDRERQLVNLMRVNILKRMESSISSFGITISNILNVINNVLEQIDRKQFEFNPDLHITEIDLEENEHEELMFGNKVKVLFQDMDLIKWAQDLEDDKERLEKLLTAAKEIDAVRDSKLTDLKTLIKNKIINPLNKGNKKVIIFTAFADTAKYLYEHISGWAMNEFKIHSAMVVGSDANQTTLKKLKRKDINSILTNFSPRSKEREKIYPEITEDIDVLIATDCISEGQNLQDCDYLINYDIHWNPVRIIQRFGRIDRIGSINEKIQLVNFWPNIELDEYINLEARVQSRMVLLDTSATGEENLIEYDENKQMNDLQYRKKQLESLQDAVLDLEDISGSISITDLTFNDFKIELMEFMKDNREKLDKAPYGMYAITKLDESLKEQISPGVIFTLKQIQGKQQPKEKNVLAPYYMVYISNEGEVKYSFLHSKKLLDFYKKLCSGNKEVLTELIKEFNAETNEGSNMSNYSSLLEQAIDSIIGKKEEAGVMSLFSKGGTSFYKGASSNLEEFELVTFLIIKE